MRALRTLPTRRLLLLCLGAGLLLAAVVGAATAIGSGGPKPPKRSLAAAVHRAIAAPPVSGVTAHIDYTNKLIASSDVRGTDPLLSHAPGRLWATADGRMRLELQSDNGDAQVVVNGRRAWAYDPNSNAVYRATLPPQQREKKHAPPTLAEVQKQLTQLARQVLLSGAQPGNVAGQPAYTVRLAPRRDGGLLGAVRLAWDANHGFPLRAAVYPRGSATPVLELKATDLQVGAITPSQIAVHPPPGAKTVRVDLPTGNAKPRRRTLEVTGAAAVAKRLSFRLAAPKQLAGRPRTEVRLLGGGKDSGAQVSYGQGLGGIVVLQHPASAGKAPSASAQGRRDRGVQVPTVKIRGATAQQLATSLGTVLTFSRGGVDYTVLGSVPGRVAVAAARGL